MIEKHDFQGFEWAFFRKPPSTGYNIEERDILEMLSLIAEKSSWVQPHPTVCRDADDNNILQLTESVQADFLITGDKDLLELGTCQGTRIVAPAQFLDALEPKDSGA